MLSLFIFNGEKFVLFLINEPFNLNNDLSSRILWFFSKNSEIVFSFLYTEKIGLMHLVSFNIFSSFVLEKMEIKISDNLFLNSWFILSSNLFI